MWIIFIRISPDTDNDGARQIVAIIAVAQFLRRNGFDIEIYEKRYFLSDASRHDPLTDPGKVHVMHLRTSKPASIPIRQICRLLSAIQTITGENVLPTRNFLAFFDNGVVRETCGRSEIRQNWQRQRRR